MTDEVKCIPYQKALKIVGNVIEEEHLHEKNRRILTVYDKQGNEICWYDAEEILAEVRQEGKMRESEDVKQAAVEVILRQIPEWAAEAALKKMESSDGPGLKCSCSD
ncbi:MAG: hypothetical protein H8E41_10850 [Desulfobulbaceae bacterium]|uniref:Uncharacterized protein n=1 Tax=Candidatus Desulfobia pelagia TaxID=2841692 RepID=A0A8J6NGZ0_9BACT|nr:hypothetical protein [Candidatus Desulfobia pelagia]